MATARLSPRKFKKAYMSYGGTYDPNDPTQRTATSTVPAAAGIASAAGSLANYIPVNPSPDGHIKGGAAAARGGLKGAAEGAEIGSVIPGVGTLVGGAVGLVGGITAGLIGAGSQNSKADAYDRYNKYATQLNSEQQGDARYAANPNAKYGNAAASNFAAGGTLPTTLQAPPLSKKYRGEWNGFVDWMGKTGHNADPTLDIHTKNTGVDYLNQYIAANHTTQLSPDSISRTQQELQNFKDATWQKIQAGKVQSDAKTKGQYMPNLSPVDGWLGSKTANELFPSVIENNKSLGYVNPQAVGSNSTKPPTFGKGGSIHIKPSHEGRFTAYKERTGKSTEEALHSKDPHVRKMANFAKNAASWKKAFGGSLDSDLPPTQQVPGGSLTPMNSTTTQVNGDSHAQGGVQLPQAEVEGGETISNGFVFSKELGFADIHKPIARAIGKIEQKPMNPVRRQTLGILKGRELGLAMAQESIKHAMGLPSDLTGGQ